MAQGDKSFERLSRVLEQIADDEVAGAIALVRQHRAGKKSRDGKLCSALGLLDELEDHELMWLDMVLCVRAQQVGREGAWRRFAESSHREFVAFYR
jgi:hypothetical protein